MAVALLACFSAAGCWLTSSFDDLQGDAGSVADADVVDASAETGGEDGGDAGTSCLASTYVASVLADSPVAYYRLDESTGSTTAKDSTGTNDARYEGAVTLGVSGVLADDTAVSFDGTSGYVLGAATPAFLAKSPFTIEAWIKPSKIDGTYRGVVSNENSSITDKDGYTLFVQTNDGGPGNAGFERWQSGKSNQTLASPIAVGSWTHLVATFDGNHLTVFLNGAQIAQNTAPPVSILSGYTFAIGAMNAGATPTFFAGTIDEVAIYDHVVSSTCIAAHYHLAVP